MAMLQAIVRKGKVNAEVTPIPLPSRGSVLIRVVYSCISPGTELSGVRQSGKTLLDRVMEKPQKLLHALDAVMTEDVAAVFDKVKWGLQTGNPTGYSIAGIVAAVGDGVDEFRIGDEVAAAGAGLANHAEFVNVPLNLVMKVPNGLDLQSASTVTLGGIALQGVRRASLRLGEWGVVIGTGILGLLSIQMLSSSGVRVIAVDIKQKRLEIAAEMGAELCINPLREDSVKGVETATGGWGADGVIFTAATESSEPLSQAFKMCRKKGRVILVGVAGMNINRDDMYRNELDLLISTSYGPGRYDRDYEEKGIDYPYAFVRWTEKRNMSEYLRLLKVGHVRLEKMICRTYPIQKVSEAFEALAGPGKPLMLILDYGVTDLSTIQNSIAIPRSVVVSSKPICKGKVNVGLIGAGDFAVGMHLPNLKKLSEKYSLRAVMSRTAYKAKEVAQQFGAAYATTSLDDILSDTDIDLVIICTRHDTHADFALKALAAGKNVLVEKPLATNEEELRRITDFFSPPGPHPLLMVGFNRRFSKYAIEVRNHVEKRVNPLFVRYRLNAGYIPRNNWVHEHGGRIIGEACHIVDFMRFLTGSPVISIAVESLGPCDGKYSSSDNKSIILKHADGSVCGIDYFAVGSRQYPKEYMEVHFDDKTIIVDDYKILLGYGLKTSRISSRTSEKGQLEELQALHGALKSGVWPITLDEMLETTHITLLAASEGKV